MLHTLASRRLGPYSLDGDNVFIIYDIFRYNHYNQYNQFRNSLPSASVLLGKDFKKGDFLHVLPSIDRMEKGKDDQNHIHSTF